MALLSDLSGAIRVRPVILEDVPQIPAVHAGSEGPWVDPVRCAIWINHRLLRGFLIDVALVEDQVVGHAEWIVSDEPAPLRRHLYLGMLQVHPQSRGRGVGRAMVEAGVQHAQQHHCSHLRTIPDQDAVGFYRKCCFTPEFDIQTFHLPVQEARLPRHWECVGSVPPTVVGRLPFVLGWVQACSQHMWEVCNRPTPVYGEKQYHPAARKLDASAYVQLHYYEGSSQALAVGWALQPRYSELVTVAMSLAHRNGVKKLTVAVPAGIWGLPEDFRVAMAAPQQTTFIRQPKKSCCREQTKA